MKAIDTGAERRQRPRTSSERIGELSEHYMKNDEALRFASASLREGNAGAASRALDAVIATIPGLWALRADYVAELRRELEELRAAA